MGITDRIRMVLGRGGGQVSQPRPGQIVRASPQDTWRDYPADGLTPGRLASILKAADAGDLQAAMDLYEQMEEKDAHLFCVASTRRLALTGLPWQVVSAADVADGIDRGRPTRRRATAARCWWAWRTSTTRCNTCRWRWGGTWRPRSWSGTCRAAVTGWSVSCRCRSAD
jgi:hypothetical protein